MILQVLNKTLGRVKPLTRSAALVALLAAPIASGMNVPQARAIDLKRYPGSMCVKWAGIGMPVYDRSAIGNQSSTSTLFLECPAIRDQTGFIVHASNVHVLARAQGISCSFNSVYLDSNGNMVGWLGQVKFGEQNTVSIIDTGGAGATSLAHYYFSCTIPPTGDGKISWIATYTVEEYN